MWFVDAAARGAGTAYSAFVPGEQFTRGAGVSRKRCSGGRASRSDSEAAVLFVAVCGLLRACGADSYAVRGSASRKMNERVRSARCANKLCRRLPQAVLASVLLAASAQIAERVFRTTTIAIKRLTKP